MEKNKYKERKKINIPTYEHIKTKIEYKQLELKEKEIKKIE